MLKVDIDHKRNYNKVKWFINFRLRWISYYYKLLPAKITFKRTHKGFHVYIEALGSWDNTHIVLFQSWLGDDWLRSVRNQNRIDTGTTEDWNLLFSQKFDSKNKTLSKEKFVSHYVLK